VKGLPRGIGISGWAFWVGGLSLGLINAAVIYLTGRPWGVVAVFIGPGRETALTAGIFVGALVAALSTRELHLRPPARLRTALAALLGGVLMGYGARLALGCNLSGAIGGITSLSLHGWGYLAAMIGGALLGSSLLRRYFS